MKRRHVTLPKDKDDLTPQDAITLKVTILAVQDHRSTCDREVTLKNCPYKKTHWHTARQTAAKRVTDG